MASVHLQSSMFLHFSVFLVSVLSVVPPVPLVLPPTTADIQQSPGSLSWSAHFTWGSPFCLHTCILTFSSLVQILPVLCSSVMFSCVCCFSWPSLPICSPCLLVSLLVCTQCSSSHFMASSPSCKTRCPLSWAPSSLWSVQHRLSHKYTYIKIRRSDLLVRESMQYLALWTWVTSLSTVSPTCIHFPQVSWLQQQFSAFLTPRHFNAAPHVVVAPTIELFHYCFITVILLLLWIMM